MGLFKKKFKPLIWTRRELEYIVKTIQQDPEYGRNLMESGFLGIQNGTIKFDYWGKGVLDKWDEKEKLDNWRPTDEQETPPWDYNV